MKLQHAVLQEFDRRFGIRPSKRVIGCFISQLLEEPQFQDLWHSLDDQRFMGALRTVKEQRTQRSNKRAGGHSDAENKPATRKEK